MIDFITPPCPPFRDTDAVRAWCRNRVREIQDRHRAEMEQECAPIIAILNSLPSPPMLFTAEEMEFIKRTLIK